MAGGRYDLTVGTSERGNITVDSPDFALPEYRHALIVFGGVQVRVRGRVSVPVLLSWCWWCWWWE